MSGSPVVLSVMKPDIVTDCGNNLQVTNWKRIRIPSNFKIGNFKRIQPEVTVFSFLLQWCAIVLLHSDQFIFPKDWPHMKLSTIYHPFRGVYIRLRLSNQIFLGMFLDHLD